MHIRQHEASSFSDYVSILLARSTIWLRHCVSYQVRGGQTRFASYCSTTSETHADPTIHPFAVTSETSSDRLLRFSSSSKCPQMLQQSRLSRILGTLRMLSSRPSIYSSMLAMTSFLISPQGPGYIGFPPLLIY